jgi:Tfp pilus assembly protein PilO
MMQSLFKRYSPNAFFDRYDLSVAERRLVMVVFLVVFIILNMALIFPRFSDWAEMGQKMERAQQKIASFNTLISRSAQFRAKLAELEGIGSNVSTESQANNLMRLIQDQARKSKLPTPSISPVRISNERSTNNMFFNQKAYRVTATTDDNELIDFLVAVGSSDSMVRIHDLDLKPTQKDTKLICNMTLVANYQKQPSTD